MEHPHLFDAIAALRAEARYTDRSFIVTCYEVAPIKHGIFALDVGGVQIDADWQGARAFRVRDMPNSSGQGVNTAHDIDPDVADTVWAGEVVEVDEVSGRLYVALDANAESDRPCTGEFVVKPFAFLSRLVTATEREARGNPGRFSARLSEALGAGSPLPIAADAHGDHLAHGVADDLADDLAVWWHHARPLLWGPPGTGKTFTLARLVARAAADRNERILVVSTTNKATDEVALRIHEHLVGSGSSGRRPEVRRVGVGADAERYKLAGAERLLKGTEVEALIELARLRRRLARLTDDEEKADLWQRIKHLRAAVREAAGLFMDRRVDVIVATAYRATSALNSTDVVSLLAQEKAPFSTVVVDEAGLVSRMQTAALSLLAGVRFVLAGDPEQLAPISRVARILPAAQQRWLGASGLSHLHGVPQRPDTHMLTTQYRMAPDIRAAVADYRYGGALVDAPAVIKATAALVCDEPLKDTPRAIWYVLDEDNPEPTHLHAQRTTARRSWRRPHTEKLLERFFRAHPAAAAASGLFISPFVGQAQHIKRWLIAAGLGDRGWTASTVHKQQGAEADYVILDTVNAGSVGFTSADWQRLINVGISRARQFVVVLASRHEMQQPYLSPLAATLSPRVLRRVGSAWRWQEVAGRIRHDRSAKIRAEKPASLGSQLHARKRQRPLLTAEQARLCGHKMDGRPRLVRGVAGSGKTVVLANWLAQTARNEPQARILVAYGNRALQPLLVAHVRSASGGDDLTKNVVFGHIKDLLQDLGRHHGVTFACGEWDYDDIAKQLIDEVGLATIKPPYEALFIDEAQDFGPNALQVMTRLVRQTDPEDANARQVVVFYDNAQDIYGRGTPRWSDMGLDMRGRATVMKESYRCTLPIAEFALNVLYTMHPPTDDPDARELERRGLIETGKRGGKPWWTVRFNQVEGPPPEVRWYRDRESDMRALIARIVAWIDDGVRPGDIAVLVNKKVVGELFSARAQDALRKVGARVRFQSGVVSEQADDLVRVSTVHSFKGYDAEIVAMPCCEAFSSQETALPHNFYVGATRARSLLWVSGSDEYASAAGKSVIKAVADVYDQLLSPDHSAPGDSHIGRFRDVLARVGEEHYDWLAALFRKQDVQTDAVSDRHGAILAEPLFWYREGLFSYACFGDREPRPAEMVALERRGFSRLYIGR